MILHLSKKLQLVYLHELVLKMCIRDRPYYIVTTKGNDEILDGLNMALEKIMESEPDFALLHTNS